MKKLVVFIGIIILYFFSTHSTYASEISLKLASPEIKKGQEAQIDITLSGGEDTLGTDVIILYDPKKLEVRTVMQASLYPAYLPIQPNRVDSSAGRIILSGSANINQPVPASGVLGSIYVKPIAGGPTKLRFDYAKDATDKTGILSFAGENLLTQTPTELTLDVASDNSLQTFVETVINLFKQFFQKLLGWK